MSLFFFFFPIRWPPARMEPIKRAANMNSAFLFSVKTRFDLIEGNHGSRSRDSHPSKLRACFVSRLQKHRYLPESLRDLNKSRLPRFLSGAVRDTGSWRPLNCSTQTDDWLLIHSFFWKERLITIPISTPTATPPRPPPHPTRSCQAVKIFCSGFTGSSN